MIKKIKWSSFVWSMLLVFFIVQPGFKGLNGQESDPKTTQQQEEDKQENKKAKDTSTKAPQKGKEQTPEQTAAKRRELEAREKAKAEAQAKAKAEATAKAQEASGEYVYTNALIIQNALSATGENATIPDSQQPKEFWITLKANLEKEIADAKTNLSTMQQQLLQLRMEYLRESSPLRQNEIQAKITKLVEDIAYHEQFLTNENQLRSSLAERARKAGVPPGWVR